jgi:inosine/xanthosine triphosphatase
MLIAIGSTRGPKVQAVKEVAALLKVRFFQKAREMAFVERAVPSGVSAMPLSLGEVMAGARQRAAHLQNVLRAEGIQADFFVGLEGGFVVTQQDGKRFCFLQNWAYVSNGLQGAFGASGAIAVPERISCEVMERGRELAQVIDEFSDREDIRSQEGTWGILTCDLISRKDAFKIALLNAFAPFYNPRAYSSEAS